jgi:hypothetical protein
MVYSPWITIITNIVIAKVNEKYATSGIISAMFLTKLFFCAYYF